jgi:hypothetical protein
MKELDYIAKCYCRIISTLWMGMIYFLPFRLFSELVTVLDESREIAMRSSLSAISLFRLHG